ncbi:MAG: hypothetical protein WCO54_02175 [Bacteroidota bacterium]
MNPSLKALEALLVNFNSEKSLIAINEISPIISSDENFLDKVNKLDVAIEKNADFTGISEYIFDLMMINHLSNFIKDEDYLDSKEWLDIEDKTLERGTELMNMLLYISECRDEEIAPNIDDFLYEFLLVDEDEFQDEHRIYEDLIVNQDLVEEDVTNILLISDKIDQDSEIKELFIPFILFFQSYDEKNISRELYNRLNPTERSILGCLLAFINS